MVRILLGQIAWATYQIVRRQSSTLTHSFPLFPPVFPRISPFFPVSPAFPRFSFLRTPHFSLARTSWEPAFPNPRPSWMTTPIYHRVTHCLQKHKKTKKRRGLGIGSQAASSIGWGWSCLGKLLVPKARETAKTSFYTEIAVGTFFF